jgi:diketogulonate reductase-like aldo/keto reductase
MELITGDLVTSIGRKHNKTGAQVALRWVVQQNIPIIPKSAKISHMRENMEVFDLKFKLSPEEMQSLSDTTSPKESGTKTNPDDAQDCAFEEQELASFLV